MDTVLCKSCGKENKGKFKFCVYCGGLLETTDNSAGDIEKTFTVKDNAGFAFTEETEFAHSDASLDEKINDVNSTESNGETKKADAVDSTIKHKLNKKTIIIVAALVVVILIVIILMQATRNRRLSRQYEKNYNNYSYSDYSNDDEYQDAYVDESEDDTEYEETDLTEESIENEGYIDCLNDLTPENIGRFKNFAEGYYSNESFGDTENPSMEYVGDIVLINKGTDDGSSEFIHNKLVLVYKIHMRNTYSYIDKTTDFYWFMGYNNVDNNFTLINNYAAAKEHPDYFRPKSYVDIDGPREVLWEYRGQYSISDLIDKELSDPAFEIVENTTY